MQRTASPRGTGSARGSDPTVNAVRGEDAVRSMTLEGQRRRSVGFVERDGAEWACFLVTFQDRENRWHGYFTFRPPDASEEEVRTADIFREESEPEVERKARALGRPLLSGLLTSALHARHQKGTAPESIHRWFRELLGENSKELSRGLDDGVPAEERTLSELRSLYTAYRLDQVIHLVKLTDPEDFTDVVEHFLQGEGFGSRGRERIQRAMAVVEEIEQLLALPPFEVWVEDYLVNAPEYHRYWNDLHDGRGGADRPTTSSAARQARQG